jgi:hypothetical protein
MRQSTYLNVILTVNAVLLAGVIWTTISGGTALSQPAMAQTGTGSGAGVPNAADQRQKMIEALREMKTSVDATRKLVESGKIRVEVSNLDQIKEVKVSNIEQLRATK